MCVNGGARRFVEQSAVVSLVPLLKRNLAKKLPLRRDAPPVGASVAAVFRWKEKEQHSLELLFVRRSVNEKDAWSGQVAFPGGRRQKKTKMDLSSLDNVSEEWTDWESLRETAQRETMEEIGLDLTTPHVHWIGDLPPIQTHLRSLSVSTQVYFIDLAADEHDFKPKLQASEIADIFWVNVQELFNTQRYHVLSYPLEDIVTSLPRPSHPLPDDERLPYRSVHDFVLWGLTLRAVVNIFAVACAPLPMRPDALHFESKMLGDIVLYFLRFPEKAVAGTATISAILLVGVVYSRL